MATENVVMAAVLAEGETVIGNAACEPHVQDLCRFLVSLGAQIEGIGSNVLRIQGVDALGGGSWRIAPEHIEVASFVGLAAATGGDLTIEDVEPRDLISILPAFERLGVRVEVGESTIRVPPGQELVIQDDLGGQIPKIERRHLAGVPGRPHVDRRRRRDAGAGNGARLREDVREPPVLRGQARLDGRADHPLRPAPRRRHRPRTALRPAPESPDIRAGMAMLIAALCAEGTSTIGNIGEIDRGYERIDERLPEPRRPHRARRGVSRL